ncbi:hypothetical protein [Burkholderia cenocepacia]|uniref:hypothetical protein n=1 Tax=Burkholderia cenocepacia TaxID=95486 RepID=UPI000761333B|nr:hypothetical protein [Burkholderia cenocepacia]KWU17830.1 hypothetical protein AS149_14005 [Burkholderia cenocepacia]
MSLFIKKKEGGAALSPPTEKDFSLLVARTTNENGEESVSELLVPQKTSQDKAPEAGARGLFVRKPKDISSPARLPVVDVTDVDPVDIPVDAGVAVPTPPAEAKPAAEAPQKAGPRKASFSGLKFMDYQAPAEERQEPVLAANDAPVGEASVDAPAAVSGGHLDGTGWAAPDAGAEVGRAKTDNLKAIFVKKGAQASTAEVPAKQKKSFFGRGSKTAAKTKADAAPGNTGSTAKAAKAAGAAAASTLFKRAKSSDKAAASAIPAVGTAKRASSKTAKPGELPILVNIEGHGAVYFMVSDGGLREVKPEDLAFAASFSPDDHRFAIAAKATYQHAVDIAMSDIGEDVRIVLMAKATGAAYATAAARIDDSPVRLGPGVFLVEQVLKRNARPPGAFAVNLMLEDSASHRSLAILYYVNAQGDISAPQVSVNPTNFHFTLSEFLHKHGASDDADVLQISNAELAETAGELSLYPNEAVWRGTPVRTLAWAGVVMAMIAAIGTGAYAGFEKVQLGALHSEAKTVNARTADYDNKSGLLISSSLRSFAQTQSLDVGRLTDRAGALWVPRSKVSVEGNATHETYTLVMPVDSGEYFNNRPSVLAQLQNQNIQQLLGLTPPEGCTKNTPGVSGGVNVLQITVNCEAPADGVGRYRLD